MQVVRHARGQSAREVVDTIFAAVRDFRGDASPNDGTTRQWAIRVTA